MKLSAPIHQAREAGRLGLVLYPIPGFPSRESYERQLEYMEARPEVSLIEVAIPVIAGYSDHANQVIRMAHRTAVDAAGVDGVELFGQIRRPQKPSLIVLYSDVLEKVPYDALLERYGDRFEGIVLEWDAPDPAPYLPSARRAGVEVVQCIGPWMDAATIHAIVDGCVPGGLVYLMSAAMTGAQLFEPYELATCVAHARHHRDDLTFAAGFGIRSGADVRRLRQVDGLDAVIVGTAYLEAATRSQSAVEELVDELCGALG
jgi:tryptophan synthase alpha subunit